MKRLKYYAVRCGRRPGVYLSWDECREQVIYYKYADYKSFTNMEDALEYANVKSVCMTKMIMY